VRHMVRLARVEIPGHPHAYAACGQATYFDASWNVINGPTCATSEILYGGYRQKTGAPLKVAHPVIFHSDERQSREVESHLPGVPQGEILRFAQNDSQKPRPQRDSSLAALAE